MATVRRLKNPAAREFRLTRQKVFEILLKLIHQNLEKF